MKNWQTKLTWTLFAIVILIPAPIFLAGCCDGPNTAVAQPRPVAVYKVTLYTAAGTVLREWDVDSDRFISDNSSGYCSFVSNRKSVRVSGTVVWEEK